MILKRKNIIKIAKNEIKGLEFIERYTGRFPLLAVVTQGYLGNCEADTFDSGQILRLHCVEKVPRIIAKVTGYSEGKYQNVTAISLPLTSKQRVYLTVNKGTVKSEIELAQSGDLPCHARLKDTYYSNSYSSNSLLIDSSLSLLLENVVETGYLLGNPVTGVKLLNHTVVIPEYIEEVRLSIVMGIYGFDCDHWEQLQLYMSDVVSRYVRFEHHSLLDEIIALSEEYSSTNMMFHFTYLHKVDGNMKSHSLAETFLSESSNTEKKVTMHSVIPDSTCEHLSRQSRNWKSKLKINSSGQLESTHAMQNRQSMFGSAIQPPARSNATEQTTNPLLKWPIIATSNEQRGPPLPKRNILQTSSGHRGPPLPNRDILETSSRQTGPPLPNRNMKEKSIGPPLPNRDTIHNSVRQKDSNLPKGGIIETPIRQRGPPLPNRDKITKSTVQPGSVRRDYEEKFIEQRGPSLHGMDSEREKSSSSQRHEEKDRKINKLYPQLPTDVSSKAIKQEYSDTSNSPSGRPSKSGGNHAEDKFQHMFGRRLEEMTVSDISKILQRLRLFDHIAKFADSLIDGIILKEFDDKILMGDFGFKKNEAIRLTKFIQTGHVPI